MFWTHNFMRKPCHAKRAIENTSKSKWLLEQIQANHGAIHLLCLSTLGPVVFAKTKLGHLKNAFHPSYFNPLFRQTSQTIEHGSAIKYLHLVREVLTFDSARAQAREDRHYRSEKIYKKKSFEFNGFCEGWIRLLT